MPQVIVQVGCRDVRSHSGLPPRSTTIWCLEPGFAHIWNANAGNSSGPGRPARQLLDARQSLRRPLTKGDVDGDTRDNQAYTRTAYNEIKSQFHRLSNPDLVMYVFPHSSGTESAPVPGYSTVFSFFQRVQYAMPGERTRRRVSSYSFRPRASFHSKGQTHFTVLKGSTRRNALDRAPLDRQCSYP